jgi:hypothetical protein
MPLTWAQVLSWRMRRQFLIQASTSDPVEIARRLAGVQAQVASSAAMAVAVRQKKPRPADVEHALADRTLVKTWAMRGTLHALPSDDVGAFLALLAATKTWEKGAWQRAFVTAAQLEAITSAVCEALENRVLTREELVAEVVERTRNPSLSEALSSGWGAVLKPLAWQGYLCYGPSQGSRVTFTRPDTWLKEWRGLPEPAEAARTAIPAYLGAYGPASMHTFDQWLCRGLSRKASLRAWFADLGDELCTVEVEGGPLYARAADADKIAATKPTDVVRLLPAFDQYVLGPGTASTAIIASERRKEISKAAGWIAPVVIAGGRVAGTWRTTSARVEVVLFPEAGPVSPEALEAEVSRIGTSLTLTVRTA